MVIICQVFVRSSVYCNLRLLAEQSMSLGCSRLPRAIVILSLATILCFRARARICGIQCRESAATRSRRSRRSIDPSALGSADHYNIGPDRRILSRRWRTDSRAKRRFLPLGRSETLYLRSIARSCLGLSTCTWRIKYSNHSSWKREKERERERRFVSASKCAISVQILIKCTKYL